MANAASMTIEDGIAVITIDSPPVNAISAAVRAGLVDSLNAAKDDKTVKAAVLTCAGRTFIAGADITEFSTGFAEPGYDKYWDALLGFSKPLVAAIHGTALGGGLETALCCDYRIASPTATIGLPEVHLGLLPGGGGTQRLPRLIGAKAALDAMISGAALPVSRAGEAIDEIVQGDLTEGAIAFAKRMLDEGEGKHPIDKMSCDNPGKEFFANYRKSIARKTRGFKAPESIIQCVEAAVSMPAKKGHAVEQKLFFELLESPESAAQRHIFFAERQVAKIPDIPKDIALRPIKTVGIVGAGTMGGGIAMNFANAGIPVVLLEVEEAALDRGLSLIRKNYENTAKKGRMTAAQVEQRMELIEGTTEYDDLDNVDLVIEAVFENMDIKKQVFTQLDKTCKPGAILATNTSTLNVDEIAAITQRPEDVIGLHFFSPANVMRLLEVVRAEKTAKDVLATCMNMAKTIRKVGVVAGVCYGFIGNRMIECYLREAWLLCLEGAPPAQIDKAIYDFGFPMGPLSMGDMAGLDVGYLIRQEMDESEYDANAAAIPDRLVELGRKGQKTAAGVYDYDPKDRSQSESEEVAKIIVEEAERLGIERREISDEEIVERCIYSLINEGAQILDEGIALRPGDIDIIYVNGYGFPAHKGGPMHYANHVGLKNVLAAIEKYKAQCGERWWQPAPLLVKLAKAGDSFS